MREAAIIVHNIRSTHNVGALLRTAEGFGIQRVYLTGYTPYPQAPNDTRLPHLRNRQTAKISKTALGAEKSSIWSHHADIAKVLDDLKESGFTIIGLEQTNSSISLPSFRFPAKCALLLGSEVEGISPDLLSQCSAVIEIPMYGKKESFNVVQAAAVTMYALRET